MAGADGAVREIALRLLDLAVDDVLPIVRVGHPVLRAVATPFDGQLAADELAALLVVMRRTMRTAPGVGLAAPQIGLPLALAVLEDPGNPEAPESRERPALPYRVIVNPRYEPVGGERVAFYEGCLSVPAYQAVVSRSRSVRLTGADETGAALDEVVRGWPARIVQHETDHLGGTLYLDRAELRSLAAADELGMRWAAERHPVAASRALGFPLVDPPGGGSADDDGDGSGDGMP